RRAGGVAQDFNHLLSAIIGFSDLALDQKSTGESLTLYLNEIRRAGERAAALTGQLLAFSRKQVLAPQVLGLNEVVEGMRGLLRRLIGEDIELVTELEPQVGAIRADRGQLEQVLLNLAVNARDAMPSGGRLTLRTATAGTRGGDGGGGAGAAPGPFFELAVIDTGCGMSDDVRAHLFEPFYTTKEKGRGTGLGLSTVYGIVTQSGGRLEVESAPGHGSTFRVLLPAVEPPTGSSTARDTAVARSRRGTETILVVEDEAVVRRVTLAVLGEQGYSLIDAADAAAALRLAADATQPIALLLTDVVMPGMNGRELADRLCLGRPGLRKLFMSGYTADTAIRRRFDAGTAEFLQKPFTPAELVRRVREVLDAPAP
ncbi:MAG: response regulator, partial [Planctomycetes bacterium]|nr:response regulator [Planctomycetota bacterium]